MPAVPWLVRVTSLSEAVSYLLLLGVAMPLKYYYGMPMAVMVVGMIHGVLFMLLVWNLLRARFEHQWPAERIWLLGIASLVPLWPFFLDRRVRVWVAESSPAR
ncbi:MAG TPA: DUF3817 domain-containing protein [bacterium]|nr:DUF3817 domain-containing protein [bacterium]